MNMNWNYPTAIRVGAGRIGELAEVCKSYNVTAPLLVTDPGVADLPMTHSMVESCKSAGLNIAVFSDVKPNPTGANVEAGVEVYMSGGHDGVIALGGGSGLDAGKAVAVAANQDCTIWDLEDIGDNWTRADASKIPPIIAMRGRIQGGFSISLNNKALFRRDQHLCLYCGHELHRSMLTRDHVIPVSRGGADVWANCVTACRSCNNRKGNRTPEVADMPVLAVPFTPNPWEYTFLERDRILGDQMDYLKQQFSSHRDWAA